MSWAAARELPAARRPLSHWRGVLMGTSYWEAAVAVQELPDVAVHVFVYVERLEGRGPGPDAGGGDEGGPLDGEGPSLDADGRQAGGDGGGGGAVEAPYNG